MGVTFLVGDIHGHYDTLVELLVQDAGLIRDDLTWIGADATVCFLGDYFDRGPDGTRTVDFLISLQIQAQMAGGRVLALLGNHDILILAAQRFGTQSGTSGPLGNFYEDWRRVGGTPRDLDQLTPEHIAWLNHLPAMAHLEDRLLVHADATFYTQYGDSVEAVNQGIETIIRGYEMDDWDVLLNQFSNRYTFSDRDWFGEPQEGGVKRAAALLSVFGGRQIIHGHTPVFRMTDQEPENVTEPFIYADGLCVNLDPGIYAGGPGFIYELPSM